MYKQKRIIRKETLKPKREGNFQLISQNVSSLSFPQLLKYHSMLANAVHLKMDILCLSETGVNIKLRQNREIIQDGPKFFWSASK